VTEKQTNSKFARYLGTGGGVALEWYDWSIYGLMAAFMAPHFFPSEDRLSSTLSALAVFALGFVVRPLSGAIFGPITDRVGHKKVLVYSIGLMSVCSMLIGLMPGYEVLGPAAGILVLVARLLQGVSTGIEQPAANAAALELADAGKRGFFSGVVNGAFNQGGNLLAAMVALLTSLAFGDEVMNDWGWRVPFVLGGIMGLLVLFIRKNLPETGAAVASNARAASTAEVWAGIRTNWFNVVTIIFVVGGTMIANYIWIAGLPNLANSMFQEDASAVFALTTGLMVLLVVAGPIVGWLADEYGSPKVYLLLRILLVPTYFAVLAYQESGLLKLALVMLGGGVIVSLNQTLFNYITATLVPQEIRTTGIALGYGVAAAVFGGTSSYLLLAAQKSGLLGLFLAYGAVVCAISVVLYVIALNRGLVIDENSDLSGKPGNGKTAADDGHERGRASRGYSAR
jgi:MFS transporter, MHS family, alpha-ketoglutarate permease